MMNGRKTAAVPARVVGATSDAGAAAARDSRQPFFPPQRAFVVQLSKDADVERGEYAGRVEHVVSGHASRFADFSELLKIIAAELGKPKGS